MRRHVQGNINGATFNTDTATRVAIGTYEDEERGMTSETILYQNEAGVFFAVEAEETSWWDQRRQEQRTRSSTNWTVVGDAARATKFCEDMGLDILRDFDDFPPEAAAGESATTVYLRAPPALKAALEARAKEDGISVNVLMLRCAEECLKRPRVVT